MSTEKRQNKGKPIFGLKKLPAEVLLKYSQQEVGKLKAYVDELEYDKKQLLEQVAEVSKENARLADKCDGIIIRIRAAAGLLYWHWLHAAGTGTMRCKW